MNDPVFPLSVRQGMWQEFWDRLLARAATRIESETTDSDEETATEAAD